MKRNGTIRAVAGFTLVEVMIVVGIIGILASIAAPGFAKARLNARVSAQMNDLRVLNDAFQMCAMDRHGFPPATWMPGVLPPAMSGYVNGNIWSNAAPCGGSYAWKQTVVNGGILYYLSLVGNVDTQVWNLVDQQMDDGDPATGKIQTGPMDHAYFIDQ